VVFEVCGQTNTETDRPADTPLIAALRLPPGCGVVIIVYTKMVAMMKIHV